MIIVYGFMLYIILMIRLFMIKFLLFVFNLCFFNCFFDCFDGFGMNIFIGGDDIVIFFESFFYIKVEFFVLYVCIDIIIFMN